MPTLTEAMGYMAAALVLATFLMTSMDRLRAVALASNLAFIAYALAAGLAPVLVLHVVLLGVNLFRLRERRQPRAPAPPALPGTPANTDRAPGPGHRGATRQRQS